ncbi:hypothetical protein GPALN_005029 [Globodera pallida]|nr:hypothetical protein GPALN_005029 [Globodera pallida]
MKSGQFGLNRTRKNFYAGRAPTTVPRWSPRPGQTTGSCDDFGINDNVGTMPPTSPFVVHTLQHSGFT